MSKIETEGKLVVEGDLSGERHEFGPDDFFFEEVSRGRGSMGLKRSYEAHLEFDDEDGDRSELVSISLNLYEYPRGATEHRETEVESGKLIQDLDYRVVPE